MPVKAPPESAYKLCKEYRNDIEIFSVKLTDSALRTLETASSIPSNTIKISVNGNRGILSIPGRKAYVSYDLSISPVHQSSDATVDVIQLLRSRAINMGKAVSKLTVQANADSFSAAKLKMAEAEDYRKCNSKPTIMSNAKRLCMREGNSNPLSAPTPPISRNVDSIISPSLAARSCSPSSVNAVKSPAATNAEVGSRSLRNRIIHLLAIQPYQRPELLLRLKRDGLSDEQKLKVDGILNKVGRLGRQGEYHLSPTFINLVELNWPGYSPSERSAVASIKAKLSTGSPCGVNSHSSLEESRASRATPSGRQDSPLASALLPGIAKIAPVEDFGRKPTLASAPSAPHALSKKIAALDLLASGLSLNYAASHHGITTTLLESWKNIEGTLRLRYSQHRGSTLPLTTTAPLSSTHDVSNNMYSCAAANTSKTDSPKRARISSDESGVHSCGSASSISGDCPLQSTSSTNRRSGTTTAVAASLLPVPPKSNSVKNSSAPCTSDFTPSRRKRPFDALCDTCAEGGGCGAVVINVSGNDQSRQGGDSLSSRPVEGHPLDIQQHRPHDRGSETSSCGNSCSPPVETTPLSQLYARAPEMDPNLNKEYRIYPSNEGKSSEIFDEDSFYDSISSENTENERLYPEITNASQAASYREAFESLYPKYLRLYEHYQVAWDKVINLKDQILLLVGGPHVEEMTCLATELDEFLNIMRKPERRAAEVRLLVMTFKLQLLKQRLAAFASQESAAAHISDGQL